MELTHLKDGMLKERAREIVKYQNFTTKSAFSKMSQKMPLCVFNAGVVYLKNGTTNPHISNRLKSMLDECVSEHVQPLIPKDNERRKFKDTSYQKLYQDKKAKLPISTMPILNCSVSAQFEYGVQVGDFIRIWDSEKEARAFLEGVNFLSKVERGHLIEVEKRVID